MIGLEGSPVPDLSQELELRALGYRRIAGLDEAGRGCWAGPVAAAAVILPLDSMFALPDLEGVRDSKLLTPRQRGFLFHRIAALALDWGVGLVPPTMVDVLGISRATDLAMRLALGRLRLSPDFLLIDFFHLPQMDIPQRGVVDGDARCLSVAAASILAKVTRDSFMQEMDRKYPGYGLASHKGYGTLLHRWCLRCHGPSAIHRLSFAPLKNLKGQMSPSEHGL